MHLTLFDDHSWENLLPLTFTRPVSGLRVGILTIADKWEKEFGIPPSFLTRPHLSGKYPCLAEGDTLLVNGALLPDERLTDAVRKLKNGEALRKEGMLLCARMEAGQLPMQSGGDRKAEAGQLPLQSGGDRKAEAGAKAAGGDGKAEAGAKAAGGDRRTDLQTENGQGHWIPRWLGRAAEYPGGISVVDYPWKIFGLNGQEIRRDLTLLTKGRSSEKLNGSVRVIGDGEVFAEKGFRGEDFTLNTETGPIYLGRGSEIMEGSHIRGPFALGEEAVVKMSAKIYGPTTIGPVCKVGGEVNNAVFQANSNKAHDGFLGNAAIGEWCNLGADTNNSNLKNNYTEVKVWNYPERKFIPTGLQFCGLFMGDHSKCSINTMFNTGTVVGVSANIFGTGFPPNFVPSFSWGGGGGLKNYKLEKALETASLVLARREQELTGEDNAILRYIYDYSATFRKYWGK